MLRDAMFCPWNAHSEAALYKYTRDPTGEGPMEQWPRHDDESIFQHDGTLKPGFRIAGSAEWHGDEDYPQLAPGEGDDGILMDQRVRTPEEIAAVAGGGEGGDPPGSDGGRGLGARGGRAGRGGRGGNGCRMVRRGVYRVPVATVLRGGQDEGGGPPAPLDGAMSQEDGEAEASPAAAEVPSTSRACFIGYGQALRVIGEYR